MNLREFWEGKVIVYRDKIYLYFQDQEITYGELDRRANQAANGFLAAGIRRGDKVCLFLPNRPEFLYLWFGLNKIGAVMVPVNLALKEKELSYIVNHSEARALVLQTSPSSLLKTLKKECPKLTTS